MRILVITRSSWSNNNNIGNTMTNLFSKFKEDIIYGLNFRSEPSCNDIAVKNFSLSEQQIFRFFKKGKKMGEVTEKTVYDPCVEKEKKIYDSAKKAGGTILLFLREFLWLVAPW